MADTQTGNDQESKVNEGTAGNQAGDNSETEQKRGEHTPENTGGSVNDSNDNDSKGSDELPEWARKQITKANNEAASYRTQLREVQDQFKDAKTEAELDAILKPLTEKLDESETRTRDLERQLVIYRHGLDDDLAEFITGDDPAAWEDQAKKLAERFSTSGGSSQQGHKGGLSGRNGAGGKTDIDPSEAAKRIVARNRY